MATITVYHDRPPASRYKNYCESQLPGRQSGASPLRCFAHQKAQVSFHPWRDQFLSEEWSWAVELARRVIVSATCQAQAVDPHLYVAFRTRRLRFRFIRDFGATGFRVRSGLGRFWFFLLRSRISNGVHKRVTGMNEPLVHHYKPSAEPSGQISIPCIDGRGHTHCLTLTGGHR